MSRKNEASNFNGFLEEGRRGDDVQKQINTHTQHRRKKDRKSSFRRGRSDSSAGSGDYDRYADQEETKQHALGNNQETDGGQAGVNQEIIENLMAQHQKNPHVVSLINRKLYDLTVIEQLPRYLLNLQEINIQKNFLNNIDILKKMHRLRKINAGDNYLSNVNLQLSKLQELDLRNNFLERVPIINQLPQLKILILNANKITDLRIMCKDSNYINIEKMNFANNSINFNNIIEVNDFAEKLKKFKQLKVLNLEHNPFEANDQYTETIVKQLPNSIDLFNNQRIQAVKNHMQKNFGTPNILEDGAAANENDMSHAYGMSQDHGMQKKQKSQNYVPTLEGLWHNLEMANSHPNNALEYLKELYVDAEKITAAQVGNQGSLDRQFTRSRDNEQINETIETFMQNAQLLVDNHFELRSIVLSILSKLTIIKSYNFGVRCFNTLKDLMVAGKELEAQVMEQLQKEVIRKLDQRNPEDIPVSLLIGLRELVEKSHQTELLSGLFETCFPLWLGDLKDHIVAKKKQNQNFSEAGHYDAIIALLAASVKGNTQNVHILIDKQIHEVIAEIFNKSSPSQNRYLSLLDCMNQIAKISSQAASLFIQKYVHKELLSEIKVTYYNYKKHNDLVSASGQESVQVIVRSFKIFSGQIELLASLLNASPAERDQILNENLVFDLLIVISHFKTDPLLLTSVCYLAEMILTRDVVKNDPAQLGRAVRAMGNCIHLIPYLGLSKYEELLRLTRKYNPNQTFADRDSESNLQYQDDPIIHSLFIAIIKLINFFCKELAIYKKSDQGSMTNKQIQCKAKFDQVCAQMNESQRETALFNCLEIPNDDVRLAVVGCMFNVPLGELDVEEIGQLLRLMQYQNIGAGKTEIVLSTIFWILTKLLKDTESLASSQFKTKFSIQAINEALQILKRNQQRVVDDEEEEWEKYVLSLSILNFFKFASEVEQTKMHLKNRSDELKQILFAEQSCTTTERFVKTPIEIEDTQLGLSFDSLRNAITAHDSINPYNYVAFRILHRMANLLQFERDIVNYDPYDSGEDILSDQTKIAGRTWGKLKESAMKPNYQYQPWFYDLLEEEKVMLESLIAAQREQGNMYQLQPREHTIADKLLQYYQYSLQEKIIKEKGYWPDFDQERMDKLKENSETAHQDYQEHHDMFTRKHGVSILRMFLMKKQTEDDNWLRANSDAAIEHAGSKERHPVFGQGLRAQIKSMKKELKKQKGAAAGERNGQGAGDGGPRQRQAGHHDDSNKAKYERMTDCFQQEELGSGFIFNQTDIYLAQHKQSSIAQKLNKREANNMGIQNLEMRSLCIAAFLRCLHASLEYAPDDEMYQDAIKNLHQDYMFKSVTQLCASTGWFEANIGTKYLQVMRYIIRLDYTVRFEKKENVMKYEVLATVIQRILSILQARIKNENDNQKLEVNDKMLLSHLAMICNEICSQCSLFRWTSKRETILGPDGGEGKAHVAKGNLVRSKQQQLIDFMLQKLFPINIVHILLEIVFQDMQGATRLYDDGSDSGSNEVQVMMEADRRSREHIKMFLSEYLANCETNKYEVLSYLMRNIVFVGKSMRTSFLEEILQGSYQAAIREAYGRYIHEQRMSLAMLIAEEMKKKRSGHGEPDDLSEVQTCQDHGERIILCQPMYVWFNGKNGYRSRTVMLTNLGMYILRDPDNNTGAVSVDDAGRTKEPCHSCPPEALCGGGPQILARFTFMQVAEIHYFEKVKQKLMLTVGQPGSYMVNKPQQQQSKPHHQTPGHTHGQTPGHTTGGDWDDEEEEKTPGGRSGGRQPQDDPRKDKRDKKISYSVQLVYPNLLSFLLLQRALHQLVECQYPEDVQMRRDDHLLEQAIKYQLGFGTKNVKEDLDMVRYVAILNSKEEGNDQVPKSRQGQSGARGFSSRMFSSAAPHSLQRLAILVITKSRIVLFQEQPQHWTRASEGEVKEQHELLDKQKQEENLDASKNRGRVKSRHHHDVQPHPEIRTALKQLVRPLWDEKLEDLTSMNVLTGKVPGVEFVFRSSSESKDRPVLSLAADFNSQLILERIKELKLQEDEEDGALSGDDGM